jgi:hypothetical protein
MVHHQEENGTERLHILYSVPYMDCVEGGGGVLFLSSGTNDRSLNPSMTLCCTSQLLTRVLLVYLGGSLSHGYDIHWAVVIDRLVC